jgi:uncharacterized repeat protein (TIGR01451 family)
MKAPALAIALLLAGLLSSAQPATAAFPGHSGDIVFVRVQSPGSNIYSMHADGTGQTQLTTSGRDMEPAWSPDGTKIAFVSFRDAGNLELYVMNADGSGQTRLTNTSGEEREPAWSPDGKKIAYAGSGGHIFVINADGSNKQQLTTGIGIDPAWSPDGKKIAYSDASDIFVMNANGSSQTNLTNDSLSNDQPSWSPFGDRIVFHNHGLSVMNADGSGQVQLTTDNDFWPAWSPDGLRITFDRLVWVSASSNYEIFSMNTNGSDQVNLTNDPSNDMEPDWQPLPYSFADLALRMSARRVCTGCQIVYKMKISNAGPSGAEDVVVSDPLPGGTRFVEAEPSQGSCSAPDPASGNTVTCSLGSLGDRAHATLRLVVTVLGGGAAVSNTATVSSTAPDPDQDDNSDTIVTRLR